MYNSVIPSSDYNTDDEKETKKTAVGQQPKGFSGFISQMKKLKGDE